MKGSRGDALFKNVDAEFMDTHLPPEENMMDNLTKLISDHKMLFDKYAAYTLEADKIFAKYALMIEALNQDHSKLKQLLTCEDNDPVFSRRQKKTKEELIELLEQEACVVKQIKSVLEQLKRDQMIVSEKEKVMLESRIRLSGFFRVIMERFQKLRYLQELEYKKYQKAVQLNLSSVENRKVRHEIDDIKATRQKYELSHKRLLDQIESIKQEKARLLEEAALCVEDKDTAESMINAILNRNKKEDDLYQQKVETMKQMIRCDTKATDFLVRKLNERVELKTLEEEKRAEELKATLEAESVALSQQKESLEAIQDVTDEKEDVDMVHSYLQKEADKMALFNYIADLNGELAHLKQQHASLLKEIESLKEVDQSLNENYNKTMTKDEATYKTLMKELEHCDRESLELNKTMERIKKFIQCTFLKLGCNLKSMEDNLGLDLEINPRNMSVYMKDIETMVCKVIHTYHYCQRLHSVNKDDAYKDEEGLEILNQAMKGFRPPLVSRIDPELQRNLYIPQSAIPNPVKDFPNFLDSAAQTLFGASGKSQEDNLITGVISRQDLIVLGKKNTNMKLGIVQRSKFLKF